MPDSAKFCPVCGASQLNSAEGKRFCPKCGLELPKGTKFCSICGAAAETVPVTPQFQTSGEMSAIGRGTESSAGSETFKTSGEMSAIGRGMEPNSDSLVSAMHSAGVPTPSNDIGNSPMSGYNAPAAASYTAPSAPANDPFSDFGAAAVVTGPVTPIKRNRVKPGVIIAAALAVIIAALAVFFFTNKAAFLSTVMGKSKYAAMVEGTHIQDTLGDADIQALSDGIKSISEIYPAMSSTGASSIGMISSSVGDAAPMMSVSGSNVDLKGLIDAYNTLLADTYGTNAVTVKVNGNISLSDSAKSVLGNSTQDISDIINRINDGTLTYEIAASDNALGYSIAAESGKLDVDMKVVANDDGTMYLMFPFAGERGIKLKVDADQTTAVQSQPLELDPEEVKRLLEETVRIYIEEYSNSAIEMENGNISAGGLTAEGKLISARFEGEKLAGLFRKIGQHLADDQYLTSKITDYAKSIGAGLSEAEYKKEITDFFNNTRIDDTCSLTINTIVDRQGGVLARRFDCADGARTMTAAYVKDKNQCAFEAAEDDMKIAVYLAKDNDKDGTVSIKATFGTQSVNAKIEYSGVEKVKFGNKETYVGNYTISAMLPADFSNSLGRDALAAVNGASIYFGASVDGNKLYSNFSIDVPKYVYLSINSAVAPKNDDSLLTSIPSDIIDASGAMDGSLDDATQKQIEDYLNSVTEKIKAQDEDFYNDIQNMFGVSMLFDDNAADQIINIDSLKDDINYDIELLEYIIDDPNYNNSRDELIAQLNTLLNDINSKPAMTANEYNTFQDTLFDIENQIYSLSEKINNAYLDSVSTGSHTNDDFDSMDIFDLSALKAEYKTRLDYFIRSETDKAQQKLYDAAATSYDKLLSDFDYYYNNPGNIALIRNIRYSLKDCITAVEALEAY